MTVSEWQRSLEDTFGKGQTVGAPLIPVLEAEQAYEEGILLTFHGYAVLSDSFHSFYYDSLLLADQHRRETRPQKRGNGIIQLTHSGNFRRFRAVEITMQHGYPLFGYALLRDLKDQAVCLGGVANGYTDMDLLNGITRAQSTGMQEIDFARLPRLRKTEETKVFKRMVGGKSGLSPQVQDDLKHWKEMCDREVHGSRLTTGAEGKAWREGRGPLPLSPEFDKASQTLHFFFNRFEEVAWLTHRLLPCLQLAPASFGQDWARKWTVLDAAFRQVLTDNAKGQPRKMSQSFIALADAKFAFLPETAAYSEI